MTCELCHRSFENVNYRIAVGNTYGPGDGIKHLCADCQHVFSNLFSCVFDVGSFAVKQLHDQQGFVLDLLISLREHFDEVWGPA